jgi:hypothetical protein
MEGRDSRGGACKQEGKREVRGGRRDERLRVNLRVKKRVQGSVNLWIEEKLVG